MEFLVGALALLVGILIGVFIGIFVGMTRMQKAIEDQSVGRLRIDRSDPDEPTQMYTELSGITPDMIAQKKFAIFEVVNESYIPRN